MNLFLKAKHWQLFLLTFGIPILFQIILMSFIFSDLAHHQDPLRIFNYFKFFPFMMLLYIGTLFGWQWSVVNGLQKMIPAEVRAKQTMFRIFFFFPIIYLLCLLTFIFTIFSHLLGSDFFSAGPHDINNGPIPSLFIIGFAVIMPLHLFAMFCIFYCIYFVAKTYKTVELQKKVSFGDFILEFFLVWFYPIGVWILQPKINQMIAQYEEQQNING
jgi:hypothetical protein